jgi:hypothetical protein
MPPPAAFAGAGAANFRPVEVGDRVMAPAEKRPIDPAVEAPQGPKLPAVVVARRPPVVRTDPVEGRPRAHDVVRVRYEDDGWEQDWETIFLDPDG